MVGGSSVRLSDPYEVSPESCSEGVNDKPKLPYDAAIRQTKSVNRM